MMSQRPRVTSEAVIFLFLLKSIWSINQVYTAFIKNNGFFKLPKSFLFRKDFNVAAANYLEQRKVRESPEA